jgi:hypothetical protein
MDRELNKETLEDFINKFNSYEAELGTFNLRDRRGYPWWDLVRYQVQLALCVERDFYGNNKSAPTPSLLIRALSFARQIRRLLRDVTKLRSRKIRRIRTILVSKRSLDYLDGVAVSEAECGNCMLFVNKTGATEAPHTAISSQSIAFLTRLTKRAQRLPPGVEREARQLANDIRVRFESKVDIFAVIATKYREEMAARRIWSFILDRVTAAERVVFVNDDTLKSLVRLARSRGLDTEEVQHAYMGKTHIGFSYPPLDASLATLPNRVIITRDTGDIIYPVERVVLKTTLKHRVATPRDIDVLIGSSPRRQKETADIAMALLGHGHQVAVKLHPAETRESWGAFVRFSLQGVAFYNGSEDFCDLACRARLFIPVNPTSTTAFEAADMGCRVVVVHFGGRKKTAVIDAVTSAHVYSLVDLRVAVQAQLDSVLQETRVDSGDRK